MWSGGKRVDRPGSAKVKVKGPMGREEALDVRL